MTTPLLVPTPLPRRRGAQPGNQNARRSGVYDKHDDLWQLFLAARETRGLTDQIAMLRVRIKLAFTRFDPLDDVLRALETLNRLLQTHHRLVHPQGDPPYDG